MKSETLKYTFTFENIVYIPLHMNVITEDNFMSDLVSESLLGAAFDQVREHGPDKVFIMDFRHLKRSAKPILHFKDILADYKIVMINLSNYLYEKYGNNETKNLFEKHDNCLFTKNTSRLPKAFYKKSIFSHEMANVWVDENLTGLLVDFFKDKSEYIPKLKFLTSSEIYANMYVSIKDLFYKPKLLTLAVYLICEKLSELNLDYTLLSASNTGGALVNIIGRVMDKDVYYLRNLGPKLGIRDKNLLDNIHGYRNYVYIYDFLCLGHEQRLAETFLKIKQANLLGCFGIAEFKKHKEGLWISIFNVVDEQFGYEIKIMDESQCQRQAQS